jgi:hypothetical protein
MRQITLQDLAQFPEAWRKLCPTLDITKPPVGHVIISDNLVAQFFPDGKVPPMAIIYGNQPRAMVTPIARSEWPLWAKALLLVAKPEDKGLGDIIARIVGPIGGDAYKAWFQKIFNRTCGCSERQETLNSKYPLP